MVLGSLWDPVALARHCFQGPLEIQLDLVFPAPLDFQEDQQDLELPVCLEGPVWRRVGGERTNPACVILMYGCIKEIVVSDTPCTNIVLS